MESRRWKQVCTPLGIFFLLYVLIFYSFRNGNSGFSSTKRRQHNRISLNLDENECSAAFPGLTKDIDDSVAGGPFTLRQAKDMGPLQARIKNGQVRSWHLSS